MPTPLTPDPEPPGRPRLRPARGARPARAGTPVECSRGTSGRRGRWLVAGLALACLAALLSGCGHGGGSGAPASESATPSEAAPSTSPSESNELPTHTAPDGRGVIRPLAAPTGCTSTVHDSDALRQALAGARPGATLCLLGDFGDSRVTVKSSGTAQAPIRILGDGNTVVGGITVQADFVDISGLNAVHPDAPGISLRGNNITVENSTSLSPHGDDGDGIRFWGSNIVIRHNTIAHTRNHHAHADCMQTFATDEDSPASQHVLIDSNRCEDISNTCLIMEGPHSLAGDGSGVGATSDITFTNNYCQNHADEALQIDDVQNLTITNNEIAGRINHAFALQNHSTGAKISGNTLNPAIHYEVGMDDTCLPGYQGPPPGGNP